METGTWLGIGALFVSAAGAYNSMRNSAHGQLDTLNTKYKQEIERLERKLDKAEEDCRTQIAGCNDQLKQERDKRRTLQEMFNQQAGRIADLERAVREAH